jgi:hypothetical protein
MEHHGTQAVKASVEAFFDSKEHFDLLCVVLAPPSGIEPPISLRLLQFAVRKALERTKYFDFYANAINENGKARFDAFRRINRSKLPESKDPGAGDPYLLVKHDRELVTTLAQANFFRLLIAHGILQHILLNASYYRELQQKHKRRLKERTPLDEAPVQPQTKRVCLRRASQGSLRICVRGRQTLCVDVHAD